MIWYDCDNVLSWECLFKTASFLSVDTFVTFNVCRHYVYSWSSCHNGMALPQLADGETVSRFGWYPQMYWIRSFGQHTRGGLQALRLGEGLNAPHLKINTIGTFTKPRIQRDHWNDVSKTLWTWDLEVRMWGFCMDPGPCTLLQEN